MYLKEVKKVLLMPNQPLHTGNADKWHEFESSLGIILPEDYKEFIMTYGTGGIDNFIWILTPFEHDENINFMAKMNVMLSSYEESKGKFPQYYKHDVFPKSEGLLPWAYSENGDEIYWLTSSNPNKWSIVVYETRSPQYHHYEMSMTEFLYKILTKELKCDAFPEDFPSEKPEFIAVNIE